MKETIKNKTTEIKKNTIEPETTESIESLLEKFKQQKQFQGEKLEFNGVENRDVYNTTAPFEYKGKQYLIGRTESPDKDTDYQSVFFEKGRDKWSPAEDTPTLNLQDPFITKINNEFIIGGVEVYSSPTAKFSNNLSYLTTFYRGSNLVELKKFTKGPEHMKDIRIIKLTNDKIGVFTRPGDIFTRLKDKIGGMIGYTEINSLEDLKPENINEAKIIGNMFNEKEWGGANSLYLLENGQIGVLGHIARINEAGEKEYYAMTWELNPETKEVSHKKIIATRDNFPVGKTKTMEYKKQKSKNYLRHIVFPSGIVIKDDNTTELYAGLSDSEEGKIEIVYPFSSPIKNFKN